jgi:NAD(P)-dependent dehydrogenase (short-subunit alcohol dehydrogenase family)
MKIEAAGAVVSGGASGLGEATVRRLHAGGAQVVIADVNPEKGQALARELGIEFVQCDVREEDQVQAAVDKAAEAEGGLRIAVSCAGTGIPIKVASSKGPHPLEAFKVLVDINLVGTFNLMRLAAFKMLSENQPNDEGERGVLINTASVAAFDGQVGQIAYSATKGGVVGMTLPAARDLADKGIRVCTIAPGLFDTPLLGALPEDARNSLGKQVPFPSRLGRPAEYAELAAHIVENAMLNGETIRLDGAIRMAPR